MKKSIGIIVCAALIAASSALAAVTVKQQPQNARERATMHKLFDHPMTRVVPVKDVRVVITTDSIMRSCCQPPDLVVAGNVINTNPHPIGYVKLNFIFLDGHGKVVYAETIYNHRAVSMGEDAEIARILNEKPHFDPLAAGATDHFSFSIPTPMLPRFSKVELSPEVINQ
ncbi:MAG TPA: hypothetical protein VMV27_17640 [Candidatus Binataceae bacterium]|nr:hypothetical protein [Candidatus Binataceae bacterium]